MKCIESVRKGGQMVNKGGILEVHKVDYIADRAIKAYNTTQRNFQRKTAYYTEHNIQFEAEEDKRNYWIQP